MVASKNYELIEHTADIGIRLKGSDLKELFKGAALAMFDIVAEKKKSETLSACLQGRAQKPEKVTIRQNAQNLEELFVNWLNELLSLSAAKELIFVDLKISKLSDKNIEAEALGQPIRDFRINTEIKAATYHELRIEKIKTGWRAEVILDV